MGAVVAVEVLALPAELLGQVQRDLLRVDPVGLMVTNEVRAHPDAAYTYINGSCVTCKSMPQHLVFHMEESIPAWAVRVRLVTPVSGDL